MKSQIVIAALLSALSVPAFAGHAAAQAAKEMVPLADGERCTSSRMERWHRKVASDAPCINPSAPQWRRRTGGTLPLPAMKLLASARCLNRSTAGNSRDLLMPPNGVRKKSQRLSDSDRRMASVTTPDRRFNV